MNVAKWLRDLGLEQYAPAFRDNDIDGKVLRRLNQHQPLAAVETVERQASHMRSASPLRRAISIPMRRNEVLHDSPLEGDGFELPVPREKKSRNLSIPSEFN